MIIVYLDFISNLFKGNKNSYDIECKVKTHDFKQSKHTISFNNERNYSLLIDKPIIVTDIMIVCL